MQRQWPRPAGSLSLFVSPTANQHGWCCKLCRVLHGAQAHKAASNGTSAANHFALPVGLRAVLWLSKFSFQKWKLKWKPIQNFVLNGLNSVVEIGPNYSAGACAARPLPLQLRKILILQIKKH